MSYLDYESYELNGFDGFEYEVEDEVFGQAEVDFELEDALAARLLRVRGERELDAFLGKLVKRGADAAGGFLRSSAGRNLVQQAKGVAKQALPRLAGKVGRQVGGRFGQADLGSQLGNKVGQFAGRLFEHEDELEYEFEQARRVTRVGLTAGKLASQVQGESPAHTARTAMRAALRRHAPGLLREAGGRQDRARRARGSWYRQGNEIVIVGA